MTGLKEPNKHNYYKSCMLPMDLKKTKLVNMTKYFGPLVY